MIKLPFNELLAYMGATHHWPMTAASNARTDEILGGPGSDLALTISGSGTENHQARTLFNYEPSQYWYYNANFGGESLRLDNVGAHITNQGLSDWTVLLFALSDRGNEDVEYFDFSINGNSMTFEDGAAAVPGALAAITFDSATGTFRTYYGQNERVSASGTNSDVGNVTLVAQTDYVLGHIAFFPKRLTASDLQTIEDQRLFTGTISGTATVDGSGAPATIRAITRQGGDLSGETTAASDGSYELWVTDPAEMDILAIPPDGVAARPLAHGPILPISVNN